MYIRIFPDIGFGIFYLISTSKLFHHQVGIQAAIEFQMCVHPEFQHHQYNQKLQYDALFIASQHQLLSDAQLRLPVLVHCQSVVLSAPSVYDELSNFKLLRFWMGLTAQSFVLTYCHESSFI